MKETTNNPQGNKLPGGLSDDDILNAISKSGYPLQTIITNKLNSTFSCQEEWSFIDKKTKEIRSLDIMAEKLLYDYNKEEKRVRPALNLLIECKKTELPYIFFLSPTRPRTTNYPLLCGLFNREIGISTNNSSSIHITPIIRALGMYNDPFIVNDVSNSMTFSKCTRTGKEITLSGTDAYHNLILPLIKSIQHFDGSETPKKTARYFDVHLPFGIGIIDGPMIGVTVNENSHESKLVPWVRVYRHESYEHDEPMERKKIFAIDIVHKDFFEVFLNDHLLPFANRYSELLLKHDVEIAEGKGFVKDFEKSYFKDFEEKLEKPNTRKRLFK